MSFSKFVKCSCGGSSGGEDDTGSTTDENISIVDTNTPPVAYK